MEQYLDRCLESLFTQRLTDIEIIAVNDGSNDSSLSILEEYARIDSRIIIIDKQNGGVSSARNMGVQAARGAYIGFVDPDDWVDAEMYQAMYESAVEADSDIVMCTYMREFETHAKEKIFNMPSKLILRSKEVQSNMLRRLVGPLREEVANPEYLDAWGTVWSKLYRAKLLKENHLRFIDLSEIGSNEDSLFNMNAFFYASSFVFLNRPFYHYWRANTDSITSRHNPMLMEKFEKLYNYIQAFITEKQLSDEYRTALNNRICMNVLGLGLNLLYEDTETSMREKLRSLNKLLSSERISRSLKQFETNYCHFVWKVFFACAKLKFSFAFYMMLVAIEWLRKRNTGRTQIATDSNIASSHSDEPRRLRNHAHELLPSNGSKENTV
jgi:glycosyltransferase EpsH